MVLGAPAPGSAGQDEILTVRVNALDSQMSRLDQHVARATKVATKMQRAAQDLSSLTTSRLRRQLSNVDEVVEEDDEASPPISPVPVSPHRIATEHISSLAPFMDDPEWVKQQHEQLLDAFKREQLGDAREDGGGGGGGGGSPSRSLPTALAKAAAVLAQAQESEERTAKRAAHKAEEVAKSAAQRELALERKAAMQALASRSAAEHASREAEKAEREAEKAERVAAERYAHGAAERKRREAAEQAKFEEMLARKYNMATLQRRVAEETVRHLT
jgi:hypothetical protein